MTRQTSDEFAEPASRIYSFAEFAERIKLELRHSWLSSGRQESVAEHSWMMALLALLSHQYLSSPPDIEKSLKMVLIHDLVEAEAGDVPFTEQGHRRDEKAHREQQAIVHIREHLASRTGDEIYQLWQEFEAGETLEARFAKALDNLEVQIQHNLADLRTWDSVEYGLVYTKMDRFCDHDPFLKALCDQIKNAAEAKWVSEGVDVEEIRTLVTETGSTSMLKLPSRGKIVGLEAARLVSRGWTRRSSGRRKPRPGAGQGQLFG